MIENIIPLPPSSEPEPLLVGPFEIYRVQVDGRIIPGLTGHPEGDRVSLIVDGRFAASFEKPAARLAAWLIANALATAHGYPHIGADEAVSPFAPKSFEIQSE